MYHHLQYFGPGPALNAPRYRFGSNTLQKTFQILFVPLGCSEYRSYTFLYSRRLNIRSGHSVLPYHPLIIFLTYLQTSFAIQHSLNKPQKCRTRSPFAYLCLLYSRILEVSLASPSRLSSFLWS
ncbi:unnamed protein product [Somion occarium]|uniref:Uncharacterized protein n=1 Tax=Somion occarium TaxID=3059160 RepID=A0ABP1DLU1_9APHY